MSRAWGMIRKADPLAKGASTWSSMDPGAPCRLCGVRLVQGHRYYLEELEAETDHRIVVHYTCLAGEEAAPGGETVVRETGRFLDLPPPSFLPPPPPKLETKAKAPWSAMF